MIKPFARRLIAALLVLIIIGLLLLLYALWEYGQIKVTALSLNAADPLLHGIKIVYAADFQYDLSPDDIGKVDGITFQKAVDLIMAQHADIILLGGDYQTYSSNWSGVIPYLQQLRAPLGVYGVFGNHDNWAKEALASALNNIRFLENETVLVPFNGTSLAITGVEDLWKGEPACDTAAMNGDAYRILLTHNPDFFESLSRQQKESYDLTLAGHIHAGQITMFGLSGFPFVLDTVTRFREKYRYGEKVYDGHRIYISSGLGGKVFNLPIRFGAQPEIVVLS